MSTDRTVVNYDYTGWVNVKETTKKANYFPKPNIHIRNGVQIVVKTVRPILVLYVTLSKKLLIYQNGSTPQLG